MLLSIPASTSRPLIKEVTEEMIENVASRMTMRAILVEDDYNLRNEIRQSYRDTPIKMFAAGNYEDAMKLVYPRFENASKFGFAISDNWFPSEKGYPPEYMANRLIDELNKEHPGIKIFGYIDNNNCLERERCTAVLKKEEASVRDLHLTIIKSFIEDYNR